MFASWYHIIYMNQAVDIIFKIAILIFSVIIHEVSHGAVAYALGDSTAKDEGRLTLNPIPHIDFFGSIILPLLLSFSHGPILGWAKPVPYNPYYLKNQKWGPALVGFAGPMSNILVAIFFGLIARYFNYFSFLPSSFYEISILIVVINLSLAIFNLVPIPPLDGSKVLFSFLPSHWSGIQEFLERYGFFILLILIFIAPGILFMIISPTITFLFRLITGLGF